MKNEELIVLGGLGLGAFLMFTRMGKGILSDTTGIDIEEITGINFELEDIMKLPAIEFIEKSPAQEAKESLKEEAEYHFPIQDLYIPPNYYSVKHEVDTNRIPSPEFWDWYQKGSAGYLEDYVYPEHHYWNPDYYYYFGNLYKKWYPNVYDISHVPPNRVPYWFGEIYY